jgi:serine phosphatase RsbU (regulator of sigma subunit)
VRDGAVARAAHDYLYTYRGGKVSATLNILSVDLVTETLVLSRNSQCPVIVVTPEAGMVMLDEPTEPIGTRRITKPSITELPLAAGMVAVVYTDGLERAGARSSQVFDIPDALQEILGQEEMTAQRIADRLLERALALEDGRPRDDVSVLVLCVTERSAKNRVRHLALRVPL